MLSTVLSKFVSLDLCFRMSYQAKYNLIRSQPPPGPIPEMKPDKMAVITQLNRIALVACERIMLLLNNSEMTKKRRMASMADVMRYLKGEHDDVGLCGDRGDFYRRKLAEQIHLNFAVTGVTHNNIMSVVESAIVLEEETRQALQCSAISRQRAPHVSIDETILNILSRMADVF